jgi:1,4-dihydroxy-2-naphthoate octaprenyltransferase
MPIFILTLSQASQINFQFSIASFIIIHFVVYPASNGYNSYIDKDETSIGGIEKPPLPTIQLFYLTLCMDALAILCSFIFINVFFAVCILVYILASRAYSSKQIRLKKYPIIGFLTVVIFQGGFTFYMSWFGITGLAFDLTIEHLYILLACSFQIAGAYPLTQVYQHEADLKDGVITLSYKLGYRGTFVFTMFMFVLCNIFYFLYFQEIGKVNQFYIIQLCFLPIIGYFMFWFIKVIKNNTAASFHNTMRMNTTAAVCMNVCFLVLFILNHLS